MFADVSGVDVIAVDVTSSLTNVLARWSSFLLFIRRFWNQTCCQIKKNKFMTIFPANFSIPLFTSKE